MTQLPNRPSITVEYEGRAYTWVTTTRAPGWWRDDDVPHWLNPNDPDDQVTIAALESMVPE